MSTVNPEAVVDFVEREAELLDNKRYAEWLDLFEPDGAYWIPADTGQTDPLVAPSHVYERRPVLDARVLRLADPNAYPQIPPSNTSRILGRIRVESADDVIFARARFHLVESRSLHTVADPQRIYAGELRFSLIVREGRLLIREKRVDLVNADCGLFGTSILL